MIKVTKIGPAPQPKQDSEIPDSYFVVGQFVYAPKIGEPIYVERWNRDGVVKYGVFVTSPLISIDKEKSLY